MSSSSSNLAPYSRSSYLPAMRIVRTPSLARWFGRFLLLAFILTPAILLFVPWAQTVEGRGTVIAFDPAQRESVVTARISGVIEKWYVRETDVVKAGDRLVDLADNDPDFAKRLSAQRAALYSRREAMLEQQTEQQGVVQAQRDARDAAINAAAAMVIAGNRSVDATRRSLVGSEALLVYERERYQSLLNLFNQGGLEAKLNVLDAEARSKRTDADVARIKEEIERAKAGVAQAEASGKKADADGQSAIASANASLDRVVQDLFSLERELQILDTQIERYNARSIIATFDGIILKIEPDASQVGQAIKEGQMLATIVPDTVDPYAAIYIDGVDAPLIQPGPDGLLPRVRLQFEGWPAIQFGPAPNLSLGTFGGRIERIDPTNNEKGQFRVLIKPEPHFEYDDWPDREYLRQGNKVQGFVFLRLVPLWYEMWRRLNGFPPMPPPLKSDKASKPPKVKV